MKKILLGLLLAAIAPLAWSQNSGGINGIPNVSVQTPVVIGHCTEWFSDTEVGDAGAPCGTSSMVYPAAGIAVSTNTAWAASITTLAELDTELGVTIPATSGTIVANDCAYWVTTNTLGSQACGAGGMTWPTGGAGIPNYSGSSSWGTTYSATNLIPANFLSAAGSTNYVQFNSSGTFGGSTYLTWNGSSNVLNVGASTTPGTVSIGALDSMVVNGVAIPVPGFALNSNIQGVIENHSYTTGTSAGAARLYLARSDGSASSPSIVVNGDHLGTIYGIGFNGTTNNYLAGGYMQFIVDGTPSGTAMPSDWILALAGATGAPAQVMRAYSNGGVVVGSPTGGNQGSGTLNATGLYVNGAAALYSGGPLGTPSSGVGTNITGVNAASVGGFTLPCTVPTMVSGDYLTNNGTTCSWAAASGGGTVTTTGTPTTGVLAAFSGSTSITNATAAQVATTLNGGTSATTTGVGNAMLATGPVFTLPGYATASLPTCNSGATGELAYTTDGTPSFTFCNGTSWVQNGGTLFTMAGTGCTPTAATGDATGGSFTLAAGPCTAVTITFNGAVGMTAAHLWVCEASDQTLQAAGTWFGTWGQSASTTTTATIPIPSAAGSTDVITFSCTPH